LSAQTEAVVPFAGCQNGELLVEGTSVDDKVWLEVLLSCHRQQVVTAGLCTMQLPVADAGLPSATLICVVPTPLPNWKLKILPLALPLLVTVVQLFAENGDTNGWEDIVLPLVENWPPKAPLVKVAVPHRVSLDTDGEKIWLLGVVPHGDVWELKTVVDWVLEEEPIVAAKKPNAWPLDDWEEQHTCGEKTGLDFWPSADAELEIPKMLFDSVVVEADVVADQPNTWPPVEDGQHTGGGKKPELDVDARLRVSEMVFDLVVVEVDVQEPFVGADQPNTWPLEVEGQQTGGGENMELDGWASVEARLRVQEVDDWPHSWLLSVDNEVEQATSWADVQTPLLPPLLLLVNGDWVATGNKDGGALVEDASGLSMMSDPTTGALEALVMQLDWHSGLWLDPEPEAHELRPALSELVEWPDWAAKISAEDDDAAGKPRELEAGEVHGTVDDCATSELTEALPETVVSWTGEPHCLLVGSRSVGETVVQVECDADWEVAKLPLSRSVVLELAAAAAVATAAANIWLASAAEEPGEIADEEGCAAAAALELSDVEAVACCWSTAAAGKPAELASWPSPPCPAAAEPVLRLFLGGDWLAIGHPQMLQITGRFPRFERLGSTMVDVCMALQARSEEQQPCCKLLAHK